MVSANVLEHINLAAENVFQKCAISDWYFHQLFAGICLVCIILTSYFQQNKQITIERINK